jgi:beta-glucuronidase
MLYPRESLTRELKSLDGLWRLCFDPEREGVQQRYFEGLPAEQALEVAVPGSINEQIVERAQYLNLDWVWYESSLFVPASWAGKRLFLRVGAACHRCDVYVNGKLVGSHEGGYLPFEIELTGVARPGEASLLVLRVDSLLSAVTVPQGGLPAEVGGVAAWRVGNNPNVHWDAFPFMGVHRPVVLYATGPTRLRSLRVATLQLARGSATLRVSCKVDGAAERVRLCIAALGADARATVASDGSAQFDLALEGVVPWSPETPRLYELELSVENDTALLDRYYLDFGVRTVRVEGGQLLLNGSPVFLRGFGKHEDATLVGRGFSAPQLVRDLNLLRWVGANSYRTAHYPHSEEAMQQADRQGILVIDEVAANTLSMRAVSDPASRQVLADAHRAQIDELIERDFNHACVIAWSLGNECETDLESGDYFGNLVRHAKRLDVTRPVLFVVNTDPQAELAAVDFDLICVNVYPSWYSYCGDLDAIAPALERTIAGFFERFGKPIVFSELGADAIAGMHSELPLMWSEEYQAEVLTRVLEVANQHPHVVGAHVWTFSDFKVGQHPGRALLNHKGVFTRDRQPKLAAHTLRGLWKRGS